MAHAGISSRFVRQTFLAGAQVEGDQERLLAALAIVLDDHEIAIDDRRAGRSPLRGRDRPPCRHRARRDRASTGACRSCRSSTGLRIPSTRRRRCRSSRATRRHGSPCRAASRAARLRRPSAPRARGRCGDRGYTASTDAAPCRATLASSTARDVRSGASLVTLIEVVRNTRSPHTTGLECARPGIGVDHATFFEPARSHVTGGEPAAATPDDPYAAERRPLLRVHVRHRQHRQSGHSGQAACPVSRFA